MEHKVLKAELVGDRYIRYTILMYGVKTTADIALRSREYLESSSFVATSKFATEQKDAIEKWILN